MCFDTVCRCTSILFEVFGVGTRLSQFVLKIQYFSISPVEYHHDHSWRNGERYEMMQPERVFSASWNCSKWPGSNRNKNSQIPFEALSWAYKLVVNFAVKKKQKYKSISNMNIFDLDCLHQNIDLITLWNSNCEWRQFNILTHWRLVL